MLSNTNQSSQSADSGWIVHLLLNLLFLKYNNTWRNSPQSICREFINPVGYFFSLVTFILWPPLLSDPSTSEGVVIQWPQSEGVVNRWPPAIISYLHSHVDQQHHHIGGLQTGWSWGARKTKHPIVIPAQHYNSLLSHLTHNATCSIVSWLHIHIWGLTIKMWSY